MKNKYILLLVLFVLISTGCTTEENAPDDQPLGVSARSFLSEEDYTSLVVEIVYVTGFEPSSSSLNAVKTFLQTYLNKPNGIVVKSSAIAAPELGSYSLSEIQEIENTHRTEFTSGNKLSTFIFIADNKSQTSTGDERILGKAYKNTSMVIFQKEVRELSETTGVPSEDIQEFTIKHEFGHLFGLVDNGTPAQSDHVFKDPNNSEEKGHCDVPGCLMARYLDYEQSGNLELGELCHLDLLANGGK